MDAYSSFGTFDYPQMLSNDYLSTFYRRQFDVLEPVTCSLLLHCKKLV